MTTTDETTTASQTATAVFSNPPSSAGLNSAGIAWASGLVTNIKKLQSYVEAGGNGASSSAVTALQEAVQSVTDALNSLIEEVHNLNTLTAQQEYELGLVTAANDIIGSVSGRANEAWEQAQIAAETNGLNMLKSYVDIGKNRTAIVNEALVRQSETDALALSVSAVNAALGATNANVTAIQQAYTNGDAALAQSLNSVSTQVAGNTASVVALTESVNGIQARWGVAVNAQGQVLGLVQLSGGASGSNFVVVANRFLIAQPDASGGDPIGVFAVGTRNGTPAIGISANVHLDGSIFARHIAVSSLDAITANLGTITAGLLQSADGKVKLNLNTGVFEIIA